MNEQQQQNGDEVTLHIPRALAVPLRDVVRAHIQELPQALRQDLQAQMSKWDSGAGGGTSSARETTGSANRG